MDQVISSRKPTVVIAVGGNALASVRTQSEGRMADTPPILGVAAAAVRFAASSRVLIVHGNGPQVGAEWLRPSNTQPSTLAEAVAKTQAGIGLELVSAIDMSLHEQGLDIHTTDCPNPRCDFYPKARKCLEADRSLPERCRASRSQDTGT